MTTWPEPGSAGDRIPLRELIGRHGALSPEAALLVFRESLLELATAHEHGGAHRDFGPESVLVGHDGGCELSDFDAPGRPGTGLAPYLAPDQQNGGWPSRAGGRPGGHDAGRQVDAALDSKSMAMCSGRAEDGFEQLRQKPIALAVTRPARAIGMSEESGTAN